VLREQPSAMAGRIVGRLRDFRVIHGVPLIPDLGCLPAISQLADTPMCSGFCQRKTCG
jgi:hypothetical protein